MSYRVFARKYRPQTFDGVVGQDHITRTLQNAILENRVAQAYMFVGPRGIGKTSTARILAKALNCEGGPTPQPCGQCAACLEIADGRSLDVIEIDGASNNGVDNIRDLRESAAYAPARGPFKIYIIDEVHMLSTGAFNALLKTLEEPPPHVKFIFATTEAQKVPATITSRCQRFDLRRIPTGAIASHLGKIAAAENIRLEPEAADAIARAAEGGLRDAESMLDQAVAFCGDDIGRDGVMEIFGFTPHETVSGLVEALLDRNAPAALDLIATQSDQGKDLARLLDDVTAHLRDLLVQGVSSDSPARREQILILLDHFAEAETRMRWASDKKLQFDVAVIKAVHLLGQASLDEVLETLASLRDGEPPRKTAPTPPPPRAATPPRPPTPAQPAPQSPPQPALQKAPTPKAPPTTEPPERVEDSVAWERVAGDFRASLISGFVAHGIFLSGDAKKIKIGFPDSLRSELESVVGERGRKEAEAKLEESLGRKVRLEFSVDDGLPAHEAAPEEEDPPPDEAPDMPDSAGTPPPGETQNTDPADDFKNDPLIRQALEKFQAELETTT